MPWYWSDEIAHTLRNAGKISDGVAAELATRPVAYRCETETVEEAADRLLQDEEIPLAA